MKIPYFSALAANKVDVCADPLYRAEGVAGLAFVHDITDGLPVEYAACDCLYADIPYPAGVKVFNARSGKHSTYTLIMREVYRTIMNINLPMVFTNGKGAAKLLPPPDHCKKIRMNGADTLAYGYNVTLDPGLRTNEDVLHWMAERYNVIGDFCCGYGLSGNIFKEHGKRYVLSDYNARCIGFIGVAL